MSTSSSFSRRKFRPPPALKAKTYIIDMPLPDQLSLGERFLIAHDRAEPALAALVATQSATVKTTLDALVKKLADLKALQDAVAIADREVVTQVKQYHVALQDYTSSAVKAADGDVVTLELLGLTPASSTRSKIVGPPDAPKNLRLSPGRAPGSLLIKHSRPKGAGSFAVEYKLEPSQAEDPWLSPPSLQSKNIAQQLTGLAPAQLVRVRVRALGDGWGPYSVEVTGRAL